MPTDQNITRTEKEKVNKYQELAFEITTIHRASKVTIIRIVTGALGSTTEGAKTWFGRLEVPDLLGSVQSSAILIIIIRITIIIIIIIKIIIIMIKIIITR